MRNQGKSLRMIIVGLSLGLLLYVILRAIRVPLTIDEAATYRRYLSTDFWALFDFSTGNNHFLNTILSKFSTLIGGNSEFILRIPNLLGYSFYLLFSYLIVSRFKNKLMALGGFLFLNVHPYLLDYFSLCRGYGLSLAFVLGAAHFYLAFLLKRCSPEDDGTRDLTISFALAAFSVMANFTLLNFYLALLFWTAVLLTIQNARENKPSRLVAQDHFSLPKLNISRTAKILFSVFGLGAVFFNIQMIFLDVRLSPTFFEPVAVRIQGLSQEERQQVFVFGVALNGKEMRFVDRQEIWEFSDNRAFRDIEFSLPRSLVRKIEKIEIWIGKVPFIIESRELEKIQEASDSRSALLDFSSPPSVSLKKSIFPHFKSILNWGGDGRFVRVAAGKAAVLVGIAGLVVLLAVLLGRGVVRWKIWRGNQYAILALTTLGLAAFAAYPLYLLKTTGQLIWGGYRGFVKATVFSLINNSFYRQIYLPRQGLIVFSLVLLSILVFILALAFQWKKRSCTEWLPGASILAILCLLSLSGILQRAIFHTPYLRARTALFFIPLYWLFLILALDFLGRTRHLKLFSALVLVAILLGLGVHFFQSANTSTVQDWPSQAYVKSMLRDLEEIREREWPRDKRMKLGISQILYPQSMYYIRRYRMDWIDAQMGRKAGDADYLFLDRKFDRSWMILVKTYPPSDIILVRPKKPGK